MTRVLGDEIIQPPLQLALLFVQWDNHFGRRGRSVPANGYVLDRLLSL